MKNSFILRVGAAVLISIMFQGGVFAGHKHQKPADEATPVKTSIDRKADRLGAVKEGEESIVRLLLQLQKSNPDSLSALLNLFNMAKKEGKNFSAFSADALYKLLPQNGLSWLCDSDLLDKNGQIKPAVFEALDLTYDIVVEGIENAQAKTFGSWLFSCFKQNAPKIIKLTAEIVVPIISNVAMGVLMKKGLSEDQAVRTVFGPEEIEDDLDGEEGSIVINKWIGDIDLLKALRELRYEIAPIIVNKNGELQNWDKIIKKLKKQIKAAIKASK